MREHRCAKQSGRDTPSASRCVPKPVLVLLLECRPPSPQGEVRIVPHGSVCVLRHVVVGSTCQQETNYRWAANVPQVPVSGAAQSHCTKVPVITSAGWAELKALQASDLKPPEKSCWLQFHPISSLGHLLIQLERSATMKHLPQTNTRRETRCMQSFLAI